VIDNSDPANPSKIGFINIPGNKDIAVKDDLLYADAGSDLLVFDITNIQNPQLIATIKGVFKKASKRPPGYPAERVDPSKGIVVGWKKVKKQKVCTGDCYGVYRPTNGGVYYDTGGLSSTASGENGGIAGSTARFAIRGDHLYA